MHELQKPEFYHIPRIVSEAVKPHESYVFAVIHWFTRMKEGRCFASNQRIAEALPYKSSSLSVANALLVLEEKGFIRRLFADENKRERTEIISFVDYRVSPVDDGVSPTDDGGYHPQMIGVSPTDEQNSNNYKEKNTISFEKISKQIHPLLGFPLPEGYEVEDLGYEDDYHHWYLKDEYGSKVSASKIAQMRKNYQNATKPKSDIKLASEFNFEPYTAIWEKYPDLQSTGITKCKNPSAKKQVLPPAKLTPDLKKLIKQYTKKYPSLADWQHAIGEYVKDILNRPEDATGYYLHRMSFYDFLYQKNGFTKFINR